MAGVVMVDFKMKGGWGYYGRLWDERWLGLLRNTEIKDGWGYYGRLCVRQKLAGVIMVDCVK